METRKETLVRRNRRTNCLPETLNRLRTVLEFEDREAFSHEQNELLANALYRAFEDSNMAERKDASGDRGQVEAALHRLLPQSDRIVAVFLDDDSGAIPISLRKVIEHFLDIYEEFGWLDVVTLDAKSGFLLHQENHDPNTWTLNVFGSEFIREMPTDS